MAEKLEAPAQDRPGRPVQRPQNWGRMIGGGLVILGTLVMIMNLTLFEARPGSNQPEVKAAHAPELQLGRLAGLVASLSVGGWLLWQLFGRQPPPQPMGSGPDLSLARRYTHQIEILLKAGSNGHEQPLLSQIRAWWQTIETMTCTLAELSRSDDLIQTDLAALPQAIDDLTGQLAAETNPLLRADLEQMLQQRQNQRLALEQLQMTRRRAEIQIERTIAVLGTIYSQLLTYRSTSRVVDYRHLADEVAGEVQRLEDYLEALQEVKGERRLFGP